ncbi:MAG: hypothetical protein FWG70_04715 [Oscillospiraceae bacterium]|nr:hypothetical protein [Oscillospiraceae bacterium]
MKCCLWLNGFKVSDARDIKNNFDLASLRGYYKGGSLLCWLETNRGEEEARRLEESADCGDLNARLEYSFGLRKSLPPKDASLITEGHVCFTRNTALYTAPARIKNSSYRVGSYRFGSGSYKFGSYRFGSGSYRFGSGSYRFGSGSYRFGSFGSGFYTSGILSGSFTEFFGYGIHII